ncbi:GDSL esterase/lipase At5g45960-like isoform X1 [Actinidia eriantha]|uniref:GDSL esterase/lipase At5g45960-like isoform X1 n=1 Tax=Actinidia eriantha TaxID=165200 RepID=UPI00258B2AEA|nr:GDSL esterase/lipase At5g45960-like isoform X1 [Actinidia eriantha]
MSSSHKHYFLLLFLCVLIMISIAHAQDHPVAKQRPLNNSVPAFFAFGDSTADPGNNNNITTIFKSNFSPYGRDFPNQVPTGRFTNGRLPNDFIASYVGIKEYVPPYMDPTLRFEELMTGVSFASAGSGFDPLTPKMSNVISLSRQLECFQEYRKRMEVLIGKEKTVNLIKKSVYLVSAGTNDFVVNYFNMPIRSKFYRLPDYMDFLMHNVQQFLQDLMDQGARRIGVVGLPPMGCLPIVITLNSDKAVQQRSCIDFYSSVARQHNAMLQTILKSMQDNSPPESGVRIVYVDVYGPLSDMISHSYNFNFDEVSNGCCGTGLMEASFLCNSKSGVCSDASKYVFWDSIHPTDKAYDLLFKALHSDIDLLIED